MEKDYEKLKQTYYKSNLWEKDKLKKFSKTFPE